MEWTVLVRALCSVLQGAVIILSELQTYAENHTHFQSARCLQLSNLKRQLDDIRDQLAKMREPVPIDDR